MYSYLPHECAVLLLVQHLGHNIGNLFYSGNVLQLKFSLFNLIAYEVMSDLDVFCPVVELGIFSDCNGRLVVHEQDSWIVIR